MGTLWLLTSVVESNEFLRLSSAAPSAEMQWFVLTLTYGQKQRPSQMQESLVCIMGSPMYCIKSLLKCKVFYTFASRLGFKRTNHDGYCWSLKRLYVISFRLLDFPFETSFPVDFCLNKNSHWIEGETSKCSTPFIL